MIGTQTKYCFGCNKYSMIPQGWFYTSEGDKLIYKCECGETMSDIIKTKFTKDEINVSWIRESSILKTPTTSIEGPVFKFKL